MSKKLAASLKKSRLYPIRGETRFLGFVVDVVQRDYTALVGSRCDSADTISVPQSLVHISTKYLTVRVPVEKLKLLERYCKKHKRTKTDVVREFIRSLATSGA